MQRYYAVIELCLRAANLTTAKTNAESLIQELKRGAAMPHIPVAEAAIFRVERLEG
jgi:hypothetical protein